MTYKKQFLSLCFLTVALCGLGNAHAGHGWKDSLHARNVFQLSSDYVTDGFCVPNVGMHYLDLTKPVYGNPQAGFDANGELLFFQYLFDAETFNQMIKDGSFSNLKTHAHAKAERMKISFGQARPEYIAPEFRDIVCNPELPDSNLCAPHYDITVFVVSDRRLRRACGGVTVPTPFPDPRDRS